jgi:adenine/guanine phosphoribosyltransferase-like PRPP-binding protein
MDVDAGGDQARAAVLLARVGIDIVALAEMGEIPKFDPFRDPAAAEELGRALADQLEPLGIDTLCVWEEPEDLILGHVVGLALGVRWTRCANADGLAVLAGALAPGSRCAIVTDAVRAIEPVKAIQSLVEVRGGQVVAVGTLLSSVALQTITSSELKIVPLLRQPALGE